MAEINLLAVMQKRARIHGSTLRARPLEEKAACARLVEREVLPGFEAGALRVPVADSFALDEAEAAYDRFSGGGKLGKVVLLPMSDWRAPELGPARTLDMANGWRIRAHVTGDGPPLVFVHGALVNANLWRKVVPRLDGFTRVTLDLPLGSHLEPMPRTPDFDVAALAGLIADALEALDLRDAIVVGNDTGGGLTQIAAATSPERIGGLVLTSCDAFENFPPRFFRIVLAPARIPGAIPLAFGGMRLRAAAAAADRLRLAHARADRARGRGLLRAAGAHAPGDPARHAAAAERASTRSTRSRPRWRSRAGSGRR